MASKRQRGRRSPSPSAAAPPSEAARAEPFAVLRRGIRQSPDAMPLAALLSLIIAAFYPAFFAGFVWDDSIFLLDAEPVRAWDGLGDIWFNPASMAEGHYWPLVYSSFWLEHKLWGYNAAGYHATNVMLHGANAVLLWRVCRRLGLPGAWIVAAVFALHPTRVEPVVWVIARKDLLATLFYLLAVVFYLRYLERPRVGAYMAAATLFAAGMLAKSFVVALPAALLVLAWWKHGRVGRDDLLRVAPLFAIGTLIIIGDLAFYFGRAILAFDYTPFERVVIAAKALWAYLGKLLLPHPLPVIYPKWEVDASRLLNWASVAAAAAVAAGLWFARRRIGRGALAGLLFFAITLSPVLGFANNSYMGISFIADRYQYLAAAGVMAVATAAVIVGVGRLRAALGVSDRAAPYVGRALVLSLLTVYGVLTHTQAKIYREPIEFFGHISRANPGEYHGHYNLGLALMELKQYGKAEAPARRAIAIAPDSSEAYQNLAVITHNLKRYDETLAALKKATALAERQTAEQYYHIGHIAAKLKKHAEAERHLSRALRMQPDHAQAKNELVFVYLDAGRYKDAQELDANIGATLSQIAAADFNAGRYENALRNYRHAVAIEPDDADARTNLAATLSQLGRRGEALAAYTDAIRTNPTHRGALAQLAGLYFNGGDWSQALDIYRRLAMAAPDDAEARTNVGAVLTKLGRTEEARQSFERALQLDPAYLPAITQLAVSRFNARRMHDAAVLFRRVVALAPDNAEAHSNLGSALAQSGDFRAAVKSFERALQLDPALASARHNLQLARQKLAAADGR